jgi:uncharacterized protein YbjT (DUF2867 family)
MEVFMKVLVIGGTGQVGSKVAAELLKRGASVRVFTRDKEAKAAPADTEVAIGDLLNPESVRAALTGVDKVFLLAGNVADELTQALIAYGLTKQAGVKHITYLSVYDAHRFADVPHFASKVAVEHTLKAFGVPYTILRPGYFFQNEMALKPMLLQMSVYTMPIGTKGISATDVRDIAEAAAITLTTQGHEGQTYNLVSSLIDGPGSAALWAKVLNKQIAYTGHDFDAWEKQMGAYFPGWLAYDMRAMFQGYVERGFASTDADVNCVTKLLGHAPKTYEAFVRETAAQWLSEYR